jgi:UDP-glucose 4-epimerase
MNNLILGGAGFIGQHLAHELLKTRQARVTIIDNLKTSKINLDQFAEYKNLFEFIEADLTTVDDSEFVRIVQKHHQVYHLAGSVGVEYIDKNPGDTMYNNVSLAHKLVPLLQKARRPVTFASTSEIYGEGPFAESDQSNIATDKLRWGYATAKLLTEFMLRANTHPTTIVRFFNVVGPGQLGDYGMVLPRFVEAAKSGQPLKVYGDGGQVRSFCHVNDAIKALIKVSKIPGETFNIGNDEPSTIMELAERVIELSGGSSTIEVVPYHSAFSNQHGDINRRVPDLTKIREAIGYQPKYTLDDIIKDML